MNFFKNLLEENMSEICETNRKITNFVGAIQKYQTLVTLGLMLTVFVLPSFAQLTPSTNPFPGQGDQTISSWGDSATNLFLYGLPIGAIFCVGMIILNVIRKQPWTNYGFGAFLCLGGWGFVGWLAFKAANGQVIRPTGGLGN